MFKDWIGCQWTLWVPVFLEAFEIGCPGGAFLNPPTLIPGGGSASAEPCASADGAEGSEGVDVWGLVGSLRMLGIA